jgi:hypothetical protein
MSIPRLYQFILSKHLIAQYIDFILEKDSPIKLTHKRFQMGNKFIAVDFSAAIDTIFQLLQKVYKVLMLELFVVWSQRIEQSATKVNAVSLEPLGGIGTELYEFLHQND